ncbi:MAG: hypothetical protein ABR499_01725 [Gemmatimonadaceae bacterium]
MKRFLARPVPAALGAAAAALLVTGCATAPSAGATQSGPATTARATAPTSATPSAAAAPTPPADPADVASIDAIMRALYDVISGPAGQRRNWDRMRSLFVPGARLIPTGRRPDGTRSMQVWTVDQYITIVGPRLEEGGFFERELARRTERFGNIVHAFSTYDSKRAASDPQPFARGINSIQLWNDGRRWWIVSILWEGERPDNPIPARYLQSEATPPA